MKAIQIKSVHLSKYYLNEDYETLFVEFPCDIKKRARHDEIDSEISNATYMFDSYDDGTPTYLEIVEYEDAAKTGFEDIPFNPLIEYEGEQMPLKDFLIGATKDNKSVKTA